MRRRRSGEIAERLAAARSHVHITGWHLEPSSEPRARPRPAGRTRSRLLAERAETIDVRAPDALDTLIGTVAAKLNA